MVTQDSPARRGKRDWPRKVTLGRATVSVYRRTTPSGNHAYMVANYAKGRRRFDSYPTESDAMDAAVRLARQISEGQVLAASLTNDDAAAFTAAMQVLADHPGISVLAAAETVSACLKIIDGGLTSIIAAAEHYAATQARVTPRSVELAVADYISVKHAQGSAKRYLEDLRSRLGQLAKAFRMEVGSISTSALQTWLDQSGLSPQSSRNFRTVLGGFFKFARARGWCSMDPTTGLVVPKVRGKGEPAIFTADEFSRLLRASSAEFLPCLVLGGFCGLRSAEIERIHWEDINLATGEVIVRRGTAKTKSRRIVPLCDAGRAWLTGYTGRSGPIWAGTHEGFHEAQQTTASATAVQKVSESAALSPVVWKANGLRHGYASHRLAVTSDAVRVAHEMGNSAEVVHAHYKALVGEPEGIAWFSISPTAPSNVTILPRKEAA